LEKEREKWERRKKGRNKESHTSTREFKVKTDLIRLSVRRHTLICGMGIICFNGNFEVIARFLRSFRIS
jgi:hypothetical protein